MITAAVMLILLSLAAWYDSHGAEVPDELTVPYAIFGYYTALLHERWITSLFCIVVLAAILIGVRIPAWNKFNAFLLRKAGSNTSEGTEEAMLEVRAAEFEASRGKLIDRTCVTTELFGALALTFATILVPHEMEPIPMIALFIFLCMMLVLIKAKDATRRVEAEESVEGISAFGGADAIVFIGILGFYGPIGFVYGMAVTITIALIWGLIHKFTNRKSVAFPLLPAVLMAAPLRIYIAYSVCPQAEQAFNWALHNINL